MIDSQTWYEWRSIVPFFVAYIAYSLQKGALWNTPV
jgi:hypothetical protein